MNFDNLGSETSTVFRSRRSHGTTNSRGSQKPPVLLDTAICILLVLLFAIICRRVV
jgi:ubiquitin-conjugating enzyme E2 J1